MRPTKRLTFPRESRVSHFYIVIGRSLSRADAHVKRAAEYTSRPFGVGSSEYSLGKTEGFSEVVRLFFTERRPMKSAPMTSIFTARHEWLKKFGRAKLRILVMLWWSTMTMARTETLTMMST